MSEIESKQFTVKLQSGGEIREQQIDIQGGDEISELVMGALREKRNELRSYEKRLELGRYSRRRKEPEKKYLRLAWQPKMDRLSKEIQILNGGSDKPIVLVRNEDGDIVGISIDVDRNSGHST